MEMTNTTAGLMLESMLAAVRVRHAVLLNQSDEPDDDPVLPDGLNAVSFKAWTYTYDELVDPSPIDHHRGGTEYMMSAPQAVMLGALLIGEAYGIDPTMPHLKEVIDGFVAPLLRLVSATAPTSIVTDVFGLLAPNWHDVAFSDDEQIVRP